MSHPNAFLGPGVGAHWRGVVEDGWPLRRAAERVQIFVPTAARCAGRYRELGEDGMEDLPSRH